MLSPYHRITDNLTGSGRVAYFDNPDKQSHTYYFSYPNLTYKLNPEVKNTFLVTVNRTITGNISDIGPTQFSQVVEATEQMLAAKK